MIAPLKFEEWGTGVSPVPHNPTTPETVQTPVLCSLPSDKLVAMLSNKNDWYVRKARRILLLPMSIPDVCPVVLGGSGAGCKDRAGGAI